MTNALFVAAKVSFLKGNLDLDNDVKIVCVDHADDTPVAATDDFLDDIAAGARVATSGNVANKTFTSGTFDHDDVTISTVTGDPFESLVWYYDSGAAGTSALVVFVDTATGLAFTPSGGNVTITISGSGVFTWTG